jgi:hypothetical protein
MDVQDELARLYEYREQAAALLNKQAAELERLRRIEAAARTALAEMDAGPAERVIASFDSLRRALDGV